MEVCSLASHLAESLESPVCWKRAREGGGSDVRGSLKTANVVTFAESEVLSAWRARGHKAITRPGHKLVDTGDKNGIGVLNKVQDEFLCSAEWQAAVHLICL